MARKYTTEEVRRRIEGDLPGCKVAVEWGYKDKKSKIPILYLGWWHEISLKHWEVDVRPSMQNSVNQTEYVKFLIETDLPGCSIPENWLYEHFDRKIPIFYKSFLHRISLNHWKADVRPCFSNLADPTAYIKKRIENDLPGCFVSTDWKYESAANKIPIFYLGWLYKIGWDKWQKNSRPCLFNIADPTAYIKDRIESDLPGCFVPFNWAYERSTKRIPIIYEGWLYEISWANWQNDTRPCLKTIADPTAFVRNLIESDSSEYSIPADWTYKSYKKDLIPIYCKGLLHLISLQTWDMDNRPCFKNLADKTSFVIDHCKKLGLVLPLGFQYKDGTSSFFVTLPDGAKRKTCWDQIRKGFYPGSMNAILSNSIRGCLSKTKNEIDHCDLTGDDFSKQRMAREIAGKINTSIGPRPNTKWHLDHVVPVSFFDCGSIANSNKGQIESCWNPANLRWLEASQNIRRKNKLTEAEVAHMTNEQLSILRSASRRDEWGWTDSRIDAVLAKGKKHDPAQLKLNLLAATHVA